VNEVISTAMAKLTTAGPTVDISGKLSLFNQERHTQAHELVLATHKERSSVVAKFKSQKIVRLRLWRFQRRRGRVRQRRRRKEIPSSAHRTSTQEAASSRRQLRCRRAKWRGGC
jgi:hypothetical protein